MSYFIPGQWTTTVVAQSLALLWVSGVAGPEGVNTGTTGNTARKQCEENAVTVAEITTENLCYMGMDNDY